MVLCVLYWKAVSYTHLDVYKRQGSFGIKALETKWITGRQIEAARIAGTRYMQRQGQIWIRIFPDKPITRKPADVRMGKGKGAPEGFVAPVTPGTVSYTHLDVYKRQMQQFRWQLYQCCVALHLRIRVFRHCWTMFVLSCLLHWILRM